MSDLLREGIAAAQSGERERARDLLVRVVEQDEENVAAWLWLSGVVDSLEDREVCLENILTLDPEHTAALEGLDWVRQQKERQAPPVASPKESPVMLRARTPLSRAAAIFRDDLVASQPSSDLEQLLPSEPPAAMLLEDSDAPQPLPQPKPEPGPGPPPASTRDEFDDDFLCP